jgi:hypothetical protein
MIICILSRMLTFASGWTIPEAIAQTFALVIEKLGLKPRPRRTALQGVVV